MIKKIKLIFNVLFLNLMEFFVNKVLKNTDNKGILLHSKSVSDVFIKNFPTAYIIIDNKGIIISANSKFEKLTCLKTNKITGNDYKSGLTSFVNPKLEICINNLIKKNKPFEYEYNNYIVINKKKEFFRIRGMLLKKIDSHISYYIIFLLNISKQKKKEITLIDKTDRYKDIFENANDLIIIFEPENEKILDANSKATEVLGYTKKELIGSSLKKLTLDVEKGENIIDNILKSGSVKNYETAYYKKDGSVIQMLANASKIKVKNKNCILSIGTDISELSQTVKALNISEQKFRTLFESANDAIWIIKNYKLVDCNTKFLDMFKFSEEQIKGISPADFSPEYQNDGMLSKIKSIEKIDKAIEGEPQFFEWTHKKADDSLIDVEVSLSKFEFDGEIFVQAILRDITEKKLADAEILKLSRAIRQNPVSIVITDTKGLIEYVNPKFCDMTGYMLEEVIGHLPNILKSGEMTNSIYDDLWKTIINGNDWSGELLNRKKNGETYWVAITVSPVKNEHGKITNYLAISEDISYKKLKDEQLLNSYKEIEVLLKEIHHRVKNNLQVILSLLKLQSEYITDTKALEYFKVSEDRIRSMAMIHELLYGSDNLSKINFIEYIHKLSNYLLNSYGFKEKGIKLKVNIDGINLGIDTAVPCGLLINELLTNSLKHAFKDEKKGIIEISMDNIKDNIVLGIKDNGCGFPDDLDYLNTKTLGMQLVTALTEQLNGTIELKVDNGTNFVITFPPDVYQKRF